MYWFFEQPNLHCADQNKASEFTEKIKYVGWFGEKELLDQELIQKKINGLVQKMFGQKALKAKEIENRKRSREDVNKKCVEIIAKK